MPSIPSVVSQMCLGSFMHPTALVGHFYGVLRNRTVNTSTVKELISNSSALLTLVHLPVCLRMRTKYSLNSSACLRVQATAALAMAQTQHKYLYEIIPILQPATGEAFNY